MEGKRKKWCLNDPKVIEGVGSGLRMRNIFPLTRGRDLKIGSSRKHDSWMWALDMEGMGPWTPVGAWIVFQGNGSTSPPKLEVEEGKLNDLLDGLGVEGQGERWYLEENGRGEQHLLTVTLLRNQLCTKSKRLWVTKRDRIAWVYGSANKMKCDFSRMPFWSSCLVFPQYSHSSCAGFNTFLFLHFSISTHLSGIVYLEEKISILIHFCHQ